jgi:hypothetical protein
MGKFEKAADKAIAKNQKKLVPVSDKDVEFLNTSKSKDYDDDGYEEGKSKDREISLAELMRDRPGSYAEASQEEISEARGKIRDKAKVGKGLK